MIYTVTLNPSVDYYLSLEENLLIDEVNRGTNEVYKAGGKGLNVSRILSLYGIESNAVCLLGGFTGAYIRDYFRSYPLVHIVPIEADGINRINLKASQGNHSLVINGSGPLAGEKAKKQLWQVMEKVSSSDCVILSGSMMQGFDASDFIRLCETVHAHAGQLVLDMEMKDAGLLKQCAPDLIKPNLYELKMLLHDETITAENIPARVKPLSEMGISDILVSLGADGAMLVTGEEVWKMDQPHTVFRNKAGAGDAMLASYIARLSMGFDKKDALTYAGAAGNAAAAEITDITYQDIEKYLPFINVSSLTYSR